MKEELEYLSYTLDKYDEVISDSNLKLSNLRNLYKNDYDAMMEEKYKLEYEELNQWRKKVKNFAKKHFNLV